MSVTLGHISAHAVLLNSLNIVIVCQVGHFPYMMYGIRTVLTFRPVNNFTLCSLPFFFGDSVAEWLACLTQVQ